jgi:glucan phosphoethanolaminetransferase (alkaline phosphatase superfamily)
MIQRIQSLYLLMTTIMAGLFLTGRIINFTGENSGRLAIDFFGIERITGGTGIEYIERLPLLSGILILVPLLSFFIIFIFRNRKLQMKLALLLIFVIFALICALGYFSYNIIYKYDADIIPAIRLILPLLMLITSYLAYRGIKKDDDLVRSYDRLR